MGNKYFAVPAHIVGWLTGYDSQAAAIAAASCEVEKEKAPRVVIQICSVVKPSHVPRVEVTNYEPVEVGHG